MSRQFVVNRIVFSWQNHHWTVKTRVC